MIRRRVPNGATAAERIALRSTRDDSGCWLWTACIDVDGYGHITMNGVTHYAHRLAYETFVGPIPDGLHLDHLCRVTHCVNPAHLEPVTNAENLRRQAAAQTHCKHGHEFTPENTHVSTGRDGNKRNCRRCSVRRSADYKARRVAAAKGGAS